jgi:hypothetical protein
LPTMLLRPRTTTPRASPCVHPAHQKFTTGNHTKATDILVGSWSLSAPPKHRLPFRPRRRTPWKNLVRYLSGLTLTTYRNIKRGDNRREKSRCRS